MRTKFRFENLKIRNHLEDLGIDGRIIYCILYHRAGRCGLDSSGSL
jgi:hypothetical protein